MNVSNSSFQQKQNERDKRLHLSLKKRKYDYSKTELYLFVNTTFHGTNKNVQITLFNIACKCLNIDFPRCCQRYLDVLYFTYSTDQLRPKFISFFRNDVESFSLPGLGINRLHYFVKVIYLPQIIILTEKGKFEDKSLSTLKEFQKFKFKERQSTSVQRFSEEFHEEGNNANIERSLSLTLPNISNSEEHIEFQSSIFSNFEIDFESEFEFEIEQKASPLDHFWFSEMNSDLYECPCF